MAYTLFDANRLLMMIATLRAYTKNLRLDASEISVKDLERQWDELTNALYSCFYYAQEYRMPLGDYKEELRDIVDDLYNIEKTLKSRKGKRFEISEKFAKNAIGIANYTFSGRYAKIPSFL